jgi:hypothetical protein
MHKTASISLVSTKRGLSLTEPEKASKSISGNARYSVHLSPQPFAEDPPQQPSLTHPSSSALLAAPSRRLVASADNNGYREVDGFLRLTSRASQNSDPVFGPISRGDANSDSELSASDAERESSDDDHPPTLTSHQLAIKTLEESLTADPSSVQTWLSLVAQSLSVVPLTSKNANKTRSEITLSILSRARAAHPSNPRSPTLSLRYLRAAEELWHQTKLMAEWEGALKLGGIGIWMEWLEWRIRTSVGGIDQVVWDATRALKALGNSEDGELDRLRIVWRVAVAFQEAGTNHGSWDCYRVLTPLFA